MTSTQEQLLSLLSNRLFDRKSDAAITEEIQQEANQQAVSLLIDESNYKKLSQNIRVDFAHAELTRVLADIPFVTIKGYASAYYYPQPTLRTMGDVDFYVEPEYYEKAKATLIQNGYKYLEEEHDRHESFRKEKILFELHSEIKGIPNGKDGIKTTSKDAEAKVRGYLSDITQTAVTVPTQHGEIIIPDDFHHGLVMLLHVAGHIMNGEGIGLRHLCDWAVYADKVNVSEFSEQYRDMGLWTFACQLTALCSRYLGLPEKEWIGEQDEVFLDDFMEDILAGGNFGRKDTGRAAWLGMAKENSIVSSLAQMTMKRYKVAQKYKVLLPGAMVVHGCAYLWERATGQKKWVTIKNLSDGERRNKLYKEFKLFS